MRMLTILLVVTAAAACGDNGVRSDRAATTPVTTDVAWVEAVPALDVEIVGDLDDDDRRMVDWALWRFDQADLLLPERISFEFDPTGVSCDGCQAICHVDQIPPAVTICAPAGESAHRVLVRRIAVLHELAHLWHRARGTGAYWPDDTDVVGGEINGHIGWEFRMKERVAVAMSWGLLDQTRRPVISDLPCRTLFVQFRELAGQPPLEPIEDVCRP